MVLQVQRRLQARRVEICPHHLLGGLHAESALAAEDFGHRLCIVDHRGIASYPRGDTEPQRLFGVDLACRQDQIERRTRTDDARQGIADADVTTADVTGQCDGEPAAVRDSVEPRRSPSDGDGVSAW